MNKIKAILMMSTLSVGINTAYAIGPETIKEDSNSISYPGLTYPQPQVRSVNNGSTMGLGDLLSDNITARGAAAAKNSVSEMRRQALSEIGFALGSSGGLAHKMNQIKKEIDGKASHLDKIFDFTKVTIDNGVLAPVLTEGLANYTQTNSDQIRIQDKIYKIEEPAKFVSVYPTWRTYLRFSYPSYDTPNAAYLPKNETEKLIWDQAVKEGWEQGVIQAKSIFESSYNRLERDYKGMIKYKILLAEGVITPTIIAKQNLGVTGGGKEMAINDQIIRINDHSALDPNKKNWKVEYPVTNNIKGEMK